MIWPPPVSKSSCIKNKEVEVEEHHRNVMFSKNKIHMSSECNNIKFAIRNDKSEVVYAMCKKCLITANHDVYVLKYVNDMNSCGKKQKANVSKIANQKNHKPQVKKPKKVWSIERFASSKPSKPRSCLRSKDKAPEEIKIFLKKITVLLQAPVIIVRTDNDTEFKNQVLKKYFYSVGISHQVSSVRTPQQNGVVEQRNRMLVEAARTMLIFSHAPLFLWSENDHEDIWKLVAKGDIGFFIGYYANSYAYKVYNRRTRKIIETMNVTLDELLAMAFEQRTSKPGLQSMTSLQISSGLDRTYTPSTITTQQLTKHELDLLFKAMYDDYIGGQPLAATRTGLAAQAPLVLQTPTTSTTIVDTAPTPTNSSSQATIFPNTSQDLDKLETQQQHVLNAMLDGNMFVNPFATPSTSAAESSSSQYVDLSNIHTFYQPYPHEYLWTNDHPLEQVIGEPS
ncbi:retrovirus-related pol polyprotein from transposon TNT 1-94 [Tanacetum coccineum]|uniref:Retrovirus-related pol polyprotein from transposon TNT 1-94 n=1 Tax=Tanacetum coccineum TaxID=301880 RepID=A0ABQ5DPH4_9ASTR